MELFVKDSDGNYEPITLSEAAERALRQLRFKRKKWTCVSGPNDVLTAVKALLAHDQSERFGLLYLNNRNFIIGHQILFKGTIDGCSVYPREVIHAALNAGAAALILFHNHPSGVPEPSSSDEYITRKLKNAAAMFDIRVLDHIVIGHERHVSLAERGMI